MYDDEFIIKENKIWTKDKNWTTTDTLCKVILTKLNLNA